MFSDKCVFDTSQRGSVWVTRLPTERYHDHCMQHNFHSGHAYFMVWGAISYNWKSPLVFLDGTGPKGVIVKDYLHQVLEPIVAPAFMDLLEYDASPEAQYIEDQAPIHGTGRMLRETKNILGIPLHKRPPSSPDFNPIENVWRILKQRIKARDTFPQNIHDLIKAVQEEWDHLQPSAWNQYIDNMPVRLAQVKERKGMQTEF